jgi:hypothetical protein
MFFCDRILDLMWCRAGPSRAAAESNGFRRELLDGSRSVVSRFSFETGFGFDGTIEANHISSSFPVVEVALGYQVPRRTAADHWLA